ncbi:hypothetical protein KCTCHS21_34760 [Cohnella abietis]|uniref:Uncharacterized protein n=1 Tax=Cohnella abietis TaxID=2507935 RepID=A0A3T1D7L0_9BACL|nr:hypothetical protein KCTCHS21_34760 [Cohnella abietis]
MGKGTLGGCKDDRVFGYGIAHQMRLRRPPSKKHVMLPSIGSVTIRGSNTICNLLIVGG